jgi:hypothetical protein
VNKISEFILTFLGVVFLLLGALFLMASGYGLENLVIGLVLLFLGLGLFYVIYKSQQEPVKLVPSVPMGDPGPFTKQQLSCPGCGAPATKENIEISEGGYTVSCHFCGKTSFLQEEPKW